MIKIWKELMEDTKGEKDRKDKEDTRRWKIIREKIEELLRE